MRDDRERLLDILEAIERIDKHASKGRDAFFADDLLQTWIVYHLQIIGEAARALTQEFKGAHPDIPWKQIIGMRNVLVHAYFGIDEIALWEVVERDLPNLERAVSTVLRSLDKPPE